MEIRPIRTEEDYEAALAEIESLWGASYGSPEGDRFDVLVTLVEAYEQKHYPIEPPDPIEAIFLHQMESQGLNRRDLEPLLGSRTGSGSEPKRRLDRDDPNLQKGLDFCRVLI